MVSIDNNTADFQEKRVTFDMIRSY